MYFLEARQVHRFCYRPGEPCTKVKRSLDELSAAFQEL